MKRSYKKFVSLVLGLCMILSVLYTPYVKTNATENNLLPTAYNNLVVNLRKYSKLVALDNGYMRVFYDGNKICIEYYDDNFNIQSKKSVDMELTYWGGFYAGTDAYYVVVGQANTDEDDSAEVIRVIKYDKNWNRMGAAKVTGNDSLFGGEVRYPFDYGSVEMTEYNGKLYVVTGHQGYVDSSVGQGHQGFLMIEVDTESMTGKIVKSDLWHSFAQYIDQSGSMLYVLEQSEGSGYTKLTQYDASTSNLSSKSISVLDYGGDRSSVWAVACYASVDDMEVSSNNVLCVGTSIDQSQYDTKTSDTPHNIYLTVTPKNNFTKAATSVKWLTNYTGGGKSFLGLNITKINDNRFMIAWEETDTQTTSQTDDTLSGYVLHYIFVDGSGNAISSEFTAAAPISDCHPIIKGNKIVYYASGSNMLDFYTIDANTGEFSKKMYRIAGENATWTLNGDELVISGSGAVNEPSGVHYRYPLSSTAGGYSYSSSDNDWKPIREYVKKITIESGITSIPKESFAGFNNLYEVEIKNGVTDIGEKAFYSCSALRKITIPDSVTSIGDDILWTGSYWVGSGNHVTRATIYAHDNSYAAQYAKDNNISFESITSGTITTSGIYCSGNHPSIDVGMNVQKGDEYDVVEYRWVACESSNPEGWFEIQPWTTSSNWIYWTPEKSGDYVIVCFARVVGNEEASEISASIGVNYRKHIKAICQMPYTGEGGGYLIGIESYDNPNQSYMYEMLILDCNLYVQGKDAWVYTTDKCYVPEGNALWTIWQPIYGYYWTLFRLYDADGNLIDEQCYGFENIF